MAQPPSFPFYPADWLLGTLTFSLAEDGAYLRLVMHQWNAGSVPGDDLAAVARILRVTEREARPIWATISSKFVRGDDGLWRNTRVEKQRAEKVRYHEAQAEKGRRSAQRRSNHGSTAVQSRLQPDGQPEANLSLALVSVPNGTASAGAQRKRHGDPFGMKLDLNAAAHIFAGNEQIVAIPQGWASKAMREYGLSLPDLTAFASWASDVVQREGFEDGGKRLAWLDGLLARWRVARSAPVDRASRPASAWLAEQAKIDASLPPVNPALVAELFGRGGSRG